MYENRLLRMFGSKSDKLTGEWRKLHNKELNDLYSSPNIIRVIKSRRERERERDGRGMYRVRGRGEAYTEFLVGKPEGKRLLGRPRHRWEDNIKMDLQEVGCWVWTGSSWLRIGTGGGHFLIK